MTSPTAEQTHNCRHFSAAITAAAAAVLQLGVTGCNVGYCNSSCTAARLPPQLQPCQNWCLLVREQAHAQGKDAPRRQKQHDNLCMRANAATDAPHTHTCARSPFHGSYHVCVRVSKTPSYACAIAQRALPGILFLAGSLYLAALVCARARTGCRWRRLARSFVVSFAVT